MYVEINAHATFSYLSYIMLQDIGVCQHSCHPYLNQATKTSVGITRLDRRTGLSAVG